MNHLKLTVFDLRKMDFKTFDFPKLRFSTYDDYNGQNERETIVKVESVDEKFSLFYTWGYVYADVLDEIRREVILWNSNPKKYWTELLVPILEEDTVFLERQAKEYKKNLKRTTKFLGQLKGE